MFFMDELVTGVMIVGYHRVQCIAAFSHARFSYHLKHVAVAVPS
jgi:hypothetical protein